MKTLLTIGHSTMLLPQNTDPAAILKLLVGAKVVDDKTHYTRETATHRVGRHIHAQVIEESRHAARIAVACVADDEVCTEAEWQERVNAENAAAEKEPVLPAAVG